MRFVVDDDEMKIHSPYNSRHVDVIEQQEGKNELLVEFVASHPQLCTRLG